MPPATATGRSTRATPQPHIASGAPASRAGQHAFLRLTKPTERRDALDPKGYVAVEYGRLPIAPPLPMVHASFGYWQSWTRSLRPNISAVSHLGTSITGSPDFRHIGSNGARNHFSDSRRANDRRFHVAWRISRFKFPQTSLAPFLEHQSVTSMDPLIHRRKEAGVGFIA